MTATCARHTQHWNLSVQQQLGNSIVAEIAYVGSKGTKLFASRDINQPPVRPQHSTCDIAFR